MSDNPWSQLAKSGTVRNKSSIEESGLRKVQNFIDKGIQNAESKRVSYKDADNKVLGFLGNVGADVTTNILGGARMLITHPMETAESLKNAPQAFINGVKNLPETMYQYPVTTAATVAPVVGGAKGVTNVMNKGNIVKGGVKAPTTQVQNASGLNVKTNIPSLEGKTDVINDNGILKYKNATDISELPKQQPIGRTTDARPIQGEVKSFEELPKVKEPIKTTEIEQGILTEKDLDKLKKSNIVKRATEYSESNDAIMKHLEEQYGGRENLDNLLDAVNNMNPEEYAQWKTAYLAHQKGALHGGNPADVLANRANKTNIDLNLAFGDEMLAAYSPHTGDISLAPEIFIKTHKRPFVGVSQNETITNALQHEMLHDLNMQAEMANKFKIDNTREAAIYNKRHNYPKSTNESASFGFESVDLGNQPLNPEIISGYENVGYNAELSNPQMLMQRKLYGEDIGRYKTLVEAGILKPTDLQILNEQNLMRRFDPNYQSPLDTMYLKTFDQIGNGGGV